MDQTLDQAPLMIDFKTKVFSYRPSYKYGSALFTKGTCISDTNYTVILLIVFKLPCFNKKMFCICHMRHSDKPEE